MSHVIIFIITVNMGSHNMTAIGEKLSRYSYVITKALVSFSVNKSVWTLRSCPTLQLNT